MNDKGKWQLLITEPDASRLLVMDDDGFICEITQRDDGMKNAHLIVSSLDMYKTLKNIDNETRITDDTFGYGIFIRIDNWNEYKKSLDKAEGK